jgi:hypothetical protein
LVVAESHAYTTGKGEDERRKDERRKDKERVKT